MTVLVVTAFYPSPENPALGSFIKTQMDTLTELGWAMEPFVLQGSNVRQRYLHAVPRLRRRLSHGDVDVVHANYVFAGLVARLQRRAPLVVTFNGSDLLGPVTDAGGGRSALSGLSVPASMALARVADAVIVPSAQMAGRIAFKEAVHVIPHGIDMELFAPTEQAEARRTLGLDASRRYLLFAARPDNHVKNFPLARDTADRLRETYPDLELVVAHREPQSRLALLMSACDALVFPSFQEGSPNVVRQAMACGLPIVASDVGDVRSVLDGTEGCHVRALEVAAFVDALSEVLRSPRRTDGRSAVARFDRRATARRVAGVYRSVRRGEDETDGDEALL